MKILLINPPIVWGGLKRPIFPLGIAYIGTFLENHNHEVRLIDLNIHANHLQELKKLLQKDRFDFVGVSMRNLFFHNTPQIHQWDSIIKRVKNLSPYSKIICGGPAFSLLPQEIMNSIEEIDIGVIGRGEEAFLELIQKTPNEVKGVIFRDKKGIHFTTSREETNLADLPIPKRVWLDLNPFQYNILNLQTRQGCPFECRYCQYKYFEGSKMRYRDLASVHKEIDYLSSFKRKIFFVDNIFNYSIAYSLEIINILKKYDLEWQGFFRANLLNKDYMEKLSKAGCKNIIVSAESGSQYIHNYLNTGIQVNTILNILRLPSFARNKMNLSFSFMIGIPKERVIDVFKTLYLIVKILFKRYSIGITLFLCNHQSQIGKEELSKRGKISISLMNSPLYKRILYPLYWIFFIFDFIFKRKLEMK